LTDKKALASGGGPYLNKNQRPPPDVSNSYTLNTNIFDRLFTLGVRV
jgi:hypothetical protein